jgi:hypothetical protein
VRASVAYCCTYDGATQGGVLVGFRMPDPNGVFRRRGETFIIILTVINDYPENVTDVTIDFSAGTLDGVRAGALGQFYIDQDRQNPEYNMTVAFVEDADVNTYRASFPSPASSVSELQIVFTMGSPEVNFRILPTIVPDIARLPLNKPAVVQAAAFRGRFFQFPLSATTVSPCIAPKRCLS